MKLSYESMVLMSKIGRSIKKKFMKTLDNPMDVQRDLLLKILKENKDTEYGKKYNFASIRSIEEYQSKVPVCGYDEFAPYVEKMLNGENNILSVEKITHFNKTSGTIGVPKKIPCSEKNIKLFGKFYAMYYNGVALSEMGAKWIRGKCLNMSEGMLTDLENEMTYGSASALSAKRLNKGIMKKINDGIYTSPVEAKLPIKGTNTRYLHARFALANKDITWASVSFVSFFLEMLRYIEKNWEMLVDDIEKGVLNDSINIPEPSRTNLSKRIKPNPKRARELREIFSNGFGGYVFTKVWPKFEVIMTVGGSTFASYTNKIKNHYFGGQLKFLYIGLSSSEGLFSVPFEMENLNSVFVPESAFMEFIPTDEEDTRYLTLDQLEIGKKYEIVLTNISGFYRYKLRDIVLITGKLRNTPTMQFLYRADAMISVTGEKTSEIALSKTVESAAKELGFDLVDYSVYPDQDSAPSRYKFLVEACSIPEGVNKEMIRQTIEKYLSVNNPSMGDKIKNGVCGPVELVMLQPETYLLYRDLMVYKGASAAQLKPVHIIRNELQKNYFFCLEDKEVE